ncbi:MAG TPA: trehalase family glycosidase [Terriglobales bacterium]|nr:trehalase family glycosidase [Terriglobales bacterium]
MTKGTIAAASLALALLLVLAPGLRPEVFYPWKSTYIGALEGSAWPGLVIATDLESAFAFVIKAERDGQTAERGDFFYLVSQVGPLAPDGAYARMKFDLGLPLKKGAETPVLLKPAPKKQTLTIEWSRRDERTVIGRILCPADIRLTVVHYFPWDAAGDYALLPGGQLHGTAGKTRGPQYLFWTHRPGARVAAGPGEVALSFSTADDRTLYFVAGAGEDAASVGDRIFRYKNALAIDDLINEEARAYDQKRVKVRGLYEGVPEAVTNNLHWTVLYQPGGHRLYTPAGRGWIFPRPDGGRDDWTIFAWDSFFNSLELAVESPRLAADALTAVLETQYPNGNIPNWRGRFGGTADRSQPPVGAYCVLKLFEKVGDIDILRAAYPRLRKWHDFWTSRKPNGRPRRDGNADGLLEWGSDAEALGRDVPPWEKGATGRQRAAWESGQDDLPNWDDVPFDEESGTLAMNCVDLSSLYALDAWCLSQVAASLGQAHDAERYLAEYERMKALVNAQLWNEKEGFYFDRFWDGRFSVHKAASGFFPLLARIPDEARARRMLNILLDPKKFWGDYVVPTISRDDPSFKPESQQYWRGTIWPPTNYLVYQGLKAYGFDLVASEFAKKSAEMFLRTWTNFQLCPENFDCLSGEAGGQRYQSWGPLFALIAVEEYLDFTPWDGFRFGMLKPDDSGILSRLSIQGRQYEVKVSNSATSLREEGEDILSADGGAVFRHFLYNESQVSFEVKTLKKRTVRLRFLRRGKYQLLVDGREVDVFRGDTARFDVPEGDHAVLLQLLENLEKQAPPRF